MEIFKGCLFLSRRVVLHLCLCLLLSRCVALHSFLALSFVFLVVSFPCFSDRRQCRRTLKWTYVFAFYMEPDREKAMFEFLQQDLEATTERLSRALELSSFKVFDKRTELNTLVLAAAQRLDSLLEGAADGFLTDVAERYCPAGFP